MPPKRKAAAEGGGAAKKKAKGDKFSGLKKDPFVEAAPSIKGVLTIPDSDGKTVEIELKPSAMATSNFGWKANGKLSLTVTVEGKPYEVSANWNLNATITSAKGSDAANGDASGDDKEEKEEKEDNEGEAEVDGATA